MSMGDPRNKNQKRTQFSDATLSVAIPYVFENEPIFPSPPTVAGILSAFIRVQRRPKNKNEPIFARKR